jgi:hypothetical protein
VQGGVGGFVFEALRELTPARAMASNRRNEPLFEEIRPYIHARRENCPNKNMVCVWRVEYEMRLKPKATHTRRKNIGARPNQWKIGQKFEGAFKPGVIGFGLVNAKDFDTIKKYFFNLLVGAL